MVHITQRHKSWALGPLQPKEPIILSLYGSKGHRPPDSIWEQGRSIRPAPPSVLSISTVVPPST